MTVHELINQQMDHFIGKLISNNQLSNEKVIEVSAHIGAYLIRTRHLQNSEIATDEINLVFQSIADFLRVNFQNQFAAEEFSLIKENTLKMLKNPDFDAEIQRYFKTFYN